jgi:hypothetical protein
LDADEYLDLVVTGEWMTTRFFRNVNGKFEPVPTNGILPAGLWKSLHVEDLDRDGDNDIILGNQGLNTRLEAGSEEPLRLYVNDFDRNGRIDQVFTRQVASSEYTLAQRNELFSQLPFLSKRFPNYASYAGRTLQQVFGEEILSSSLQYEVTELRTGILWNNGDGVFNFTALPLGAQLSPIFAIETSDINGDGLIDILLGGNHYRMKPEYGIHDGSVGSVMMNQGDQVFKMMKSSESGLEIKGEIRAIWECHILGKKAFLVGINNNKPKILISNVEVE